jgi:hypothetical protein
MSRRKAIDIEMTLPEEKIEEEKEIADELKDEEKKSPAGRWIIDEYGGQGFIYFYEERYWLVKYDRINGTCKTVFLSQEQWDERKANLKKVRENSGKK